MEACVDFHSHILPRLDDGSDSVAGSLEMLRLSAEQGIRHVAATPHFYASRDTLDRFLDARARAEEALRQEMAKHSGLPRLHVGAEVLFFRGISQCDFLHKLTISGKNCILIELPPAPWPEEVYRELGQLRTRQGITPVIAHIDRYVGPFRNRDIPGRLAQLPVLVQANGDFFLKRSTAPLAMKLLKADQIQLLGSDCHDLTHRSPNLGPALRRIERKLGGEALSRIHSYEAMLLELEPTP